MIPDSDLELEDLAWQLLVARAQNPHVDETEPSTKIVRVAWELAELYCAERDKRRAVAEAMKELEE